jgi:2-keto-4-pentenoate hydratase/2-oxohepta-3-ene-1,7-dioic acid hydratase in catechol pathway
VKLVRYGAPGREKPGLVDDAGTVRDLSGHVGDIAGDALSADGLARLAAIDPGSLAEVQVDRYGPCVGGIRKIACIGLNYSDHAAESGMDLPEEPIVFMKAVSALVGPNDEIEKPRGADAMDWEVELAVVIGTRAKYVSEAEAETHIAGYAIMNDVSERTFQQKRSGQWTKGKSHDTFGPLGPWLVTKDEIADVGNLDMWLDVNGERKQTGNTETLIFKVPHLVSYLSQFMTLEPGDIISTGTPPGVGQGMDPQQFLQEGDTVELGISGLGQQRQKVVAA